MLFSVEDAAKAVAAITDATQLELQSCITDSHLMGIADGRHLEPRRSWPLMPQVINVFKPQGKL